MSDDAPVPLAPKQDPETLILRGRPRPALRFRRGLIVGITGVVAVSLVTLSWLALDPPSFRKAAQQIETNDDQAQSQPEALANAPRSYGDVPKLGPPLPGDLGRPILAQQRELSHAISPEATGAGRLESGQSAVIEHERAAAARQAARTSGLLVQLGDHEPAASPGSASPLGDAPVHPAGPETGAAVPANQQHKLEFAGGEGATISSHGLARAPSPWTLTAGTMIPASLITGLNSDLPGIVVAQVTENVRDSATGGTILIPQGARLIGKYDSVVAYGQRRALLIWNRIVFPNGSSVELEHQPASDASGYSGLFDRVDSHGWQLLKGIIMSTVLGISTQLSLGGGGSLVRALRESAQENAARAGDQITSRNLDVQPTITVRPGWPVRALLNEDLVLQPWRG